MNKLFTLGKLLGICDRNLKFCEEHRGASLTLLLTSPRLMPPMRLDWEHMDPEDGDKILDIIHTYFRAKRAKILVEIKLAQAQEKD